MTFISTEHFPELSLCMSRENEINSSSHWTLRVQDAAFWSAQALLAGSGEALRTQKSPIFTPTPCMETEPTLYGQPQIWAQTTSSINLSFYIKR